MEQKLLMGVSIDEQQLDFMYQAPPGLEEIQQREREALLEQERQMFAPGEQQHGAGRPADAKSFYNKEAIAAEHPALKGAPVVDKFAKQNGACACAGHQA